MEFHERVVVHEVVDALAAVHEARDDAPIVHMLQPVRYGTRRHEVDDAVGKHFGVNSEIQPVGESSERGIRNGADAHLERCAILDECRDVCPDSLLDRRCCGLFVSVQRARRCG